MARGVTLGTMVTDLRAEVGHTTEAALGKNKVVQLKRILKRTQEWLFEDYDWRFLNEQHDIILKAGQRFYDFPAGVALEDVKKYAVRWGTDYIPVGVGIGAAEYAAQESEQTGASGSFKITAGAAAWATGGFTVNGGSASASNYFSQITINGSTTLLSANVLWTGSHTNTAVALVNAINAGTATHGYRASNVGAAVTIYGDPDLGTGANGYTVAVTVAGTASVTSVSNLSGGANNRITKIEVDGVDILDGSPVGWRTSNSATATAVAARINEKVTSPRYSATAAGNEVTITAVPQSADAGNDREIEVTVAGSVTASSPTDLSGGILSVRSDPVLKVDLRNNDDTVQLEVWPVPASDDNVLRLFTKKGLAPLVANDDVSTLDDRLIVLFAASEILEEQKSKRAQTVQRVAVNLYNKLRGRSGPTRRLSMLGGVASGRPAPGPIRVAYVR